MPPRLGAVAAHGHRAPASAAAGVEEEPAATLAGTPADGLEIGGGEERSCRAGELERRQIQTGAFRDHPPPAWGSVLDEHGGGRRIPCLRGPRVPGGGGGIGADGKR